MSITQSLHRAVQQSPDAEATVFGDRIRTYREHYDRVGRLAGALAGIGVSEGSRVAILALNSDRYAELLFAVPWADGVLVPTNVRWSAAEIIYSLNDSETDVICLDDAFAPMIDQILEGRPQITHVIHIGDAPTPNGALNVEELIASTNPIKDCNRRGNDLAGIFYTGGTTGFPKGVMLSHANLLTSALGSQASAHFATPGGRMLHVAPMFHLADLAALMMQALVGGTHVMLSTFDPAEVPRTMQDQAISAALLVPTMLQMVADHPTVDDYDLSSVKSIMYGASPISDALLTRSMSVFSQADFTQAYGMTELSPVATTLSAEDHRAGRNLRSAGRAAAHGEVRIVDEADNEVERGVVGEVVARGEHVMQGYWNKPKETAEALRGGWMHTGDGGYMDDRGYVYIVDRIKDMIVTGGENVYSAEVENAVMQHAAVASCAVIGVPDEDWGERVHAVVVLAPGQSLTLGELRSHTKELIAGYKTPRTIELVEAMPLSGAGKILKRELRAPYWEGHSRDVG